MQKNTINCIATIPTGYVADLDSLYYLNMDVLNTTEL